MVRYSDAEIEVLNRDLSRLRRRAARQRRQIKAGVDRWQQWSGTMDEIASLTQRLVTSSAAGPATLAAKFRAILWLIEVNESVLDTGDLRRLRRFGRELDLLTGK